MSGLVFQKVFGGLEKLQALTALVEEELYRAAALRPGFLFFFLLRFTIRMFQINQSLVLTLPEDLGSGRIGAVALPMS